MGAERIELPVDVVAAHDTGMKRLVDTVETAIERKCEWAGRLASYLSGRALAGEAESCPSRTSSCSSISSTPPNAPPTGALAERR